MKAPSRGVAFGLVVALQLAYLLAMAVAGQINRSRDTSPPLPVHLDNVYANPYRDENPFSGPHVRLEYSLPLSLDSVPEWARDLPRHSLVCLVVRLTDRGWTVEGLAGDDPPWEPGLLALPAEVSIPPTRDPFKEELTIDWKLPSSLPLSYDRDTSRSGWQEWGEYLQALLREGALGMPQVARIERTAEPLYDLAGAAWAEGDSIALFDANPAPWYRLYGREAAGHSASRLEIIGLDGIRRALHDAPEGIVAIVPETGGNGFLALRFADDREAGEIPFARRLAEGRKTGSGNTALELVRIDAGGSLVGEAMPLALSRVLSRDPIGSGFLAIQRGETTGPALVRVRPDGRVDRLEALPPNLHIDEAAVSPDGRRILLVAPRAGLVLARDGAGRPVRTVKEFGKPAGVRFTRFGDAWITDTGTGQASLTTADGAAKLTVGNLLEPVPISSDPADGSLWLTVKRYRAPDGSTYGGLLRLSREGMVIEGSLAPEEEGEEAGAEEKSAPAPSPSWRIPGPKELWGLSGGGDSLHSASVVTGVLARDDRRVLVFPRVIVVRDGPGSYRVLDRVTYPEPLVVWQPPE
jgi:hypothetical protein